MEYEEVPGKRGGVFYGTQDNHLYRFNKNAKDGKVFVYCFHVKITKDAAVTEQCKAKGVLDPVSRTIQVTQPHNHDADVALLNLLKLRKKALDSASTSKLPLNEAFKDAVRGQDGADLVSYAQMYRYVPLCCCEQCSQRKKN